MVIGAGVVGLACAVELAKHGHFVTVLERHARVAEENSSRNSGVVHSGLYYPTGSLKARLCVRGRELLMARCKKHGLAHKKLGKLIVAKDAIEGAQLEQLAARGEANGAGPLRLLDGIELAMIEESVRGHAALLVEETAIVRTQELVRSLVREAEALRVEVLVGMEVTAIERDLDAESRERWVVRVAGGDRDSGGWRAPHVVDAAGLGADHIARLAGIDTDAHGLTQRFCKGTWLALDERFRKAVGHLIYPVPQLARPADATLSAPTALPAPAALPAPTALAAPTALGIHLTRDLEGFLFAGPDAEWLDEPEARGGRSFTLESSPERAARYAWAIAAFLPGVEPRHLVPLVAGVRPKLHGPDEPAADFVIRECSALGAPHFVLLAGIESPGLTASLAIAEEVRALVEG